MKLEEVKNKENKEENQKLQLTLESVEGFPDWIQLRSDGRYLVKDRTGKEFVFEDIPNKKITAVKKRVSRGSKELDEDKMQLALISEALVEPKMGELELDELPGSVMTRLKGATMKIFDLDSFL